MEKRAIAQLRIAGNYARWNWDYCGFLQRAGARQCPPPLDRSVYSGYPAIANSAVQRVVREMAGSSSDCVRGPSVLASTESGEWQLSLNGPDVHSSG